MCVFTLACMPLISRWKTRSSRHVSCAIVFKFKFEFEFESKFECESVFESLA